MKARQVPSLLLALACFGLAACTDRAENTDPATVKPQPALSVPAEAEDANTPEPVQEAAPSTTAEEVQQEEVQQEPEAVEVTPPAASTEVQPEVEAAPAPQAVPADEVVPAEASDTPAPAVSTPATPPAPDPAAATRSDPVPDELHSEGEVVEAEPSDIYFPNCAAAAAGGYSAMKEGEAGYRAELDENGNGVACE